MQDVKLISCAFDATGDGSLQLRGLVRSGRPAIATVEVANGMASLARLVG